MSPENTVITDRDIAILGCADDLVRTAWSLKDKDRALTEQLLAMTGKLSSKFGQKENRSVKILTPGKTK